MTEQTLLLHTDKGARILQHRVQRIHDSLQELERLTRFAFTTTEGTDEAQRWIEDEGFGIDPDGYYLPLPLLESYRAGTAEEEAVSTFWDPAQISNPDAARRLHALRKFGPELQKIRSRHEGVAWVYYQDVTNVSIQFPYIDMKTAVPPDFDWSTYHTYLSVKPESAPDRGIRWTPPTIDYANEGLITSASIPVYLKDEFVGLWSIDVPLGPWFEGIAGSKAIPEESSLILTRDGDVLLHGSIPLNISQEKGSVYKASHIDLEPPFGLLDLEALFAAGSGKVGVTDGGQSWVVLFSVIPEVHWMYVSACPESALLDRAKETMQTALSKIGSGDLGYRIRGPFSSEMQTVADACNAMAESLEAGRRDQQKARDAQHHTEALLKQEKELLAVLFDSIDQVVIAVDARGSVQFVNKEGGELFGVDSDSLTGRALDSIFESLGSEWVRIVRECAKKSMQQRVSLESGELPIPTSINGSERFLTATFAPILRDHEISGAVILLHDVTQKYLLAQEQMRRNKIDSVGVLAGGIAHDFNNILTAVVGNVSLLISERQMAEDEEVAILGEVLEAGLRAKELSQQLLTFSKGGNPLRTICNIGKMLKDVSSFALRGSQVGCVLEVADDLLPVSADLGQLSQVINNLVINGQQATPGIGTITVRAFNQRGSAPGGGQLVCVEIEDEGTGIPPVMMDKIFDPYFTTKKEGSGLGLAVSYSIIAQHDGTLTVRAGKEKGAVFRIELPAQKPQAEEAPKVALPGGPMRPMRILLIEDEATIRMILKRVLTGMNHVVAESETGVEAIKAAEAAASDYSPPFDLVIADLTIPGNMGGAEAVRLLKEKYPGMKFVVSSGYSEAPVMSNYKSYGFDAVLPKPYTVAQLTAVLQQLNNDKGTS